LASSAAGSQAASHVQDGHPGASSGYTSWFWRVSVLWARKSAIDSSQLIKAPRFDCTQIQQAIALQLHRNAAYSEKGSPAGRRLSDRSRPKDSHTRSRPKPQNCATCVQI